MRVPRAGECRRRFSFLAESRRVGQAARGLAMMNRVARAAPPWCCAFAQPRRSMVGQRGWRTIAKTTVFRTGRPTRALSRGKRPRGSDLLAAQVWTGCAARRSLSSAALVLPTAVSRFTTTIQRPKPVMTPSSIVPSTATTPTMPKAIHHHGRPAVQCAECETYSPHTGQRIASS